MPVGPLPTSRLWSLLGLLAALCAAPAGAAGTTRGLLLIAPPSASAAATVFANTLLDHLAQNGQESTLLTNSSALCRAAGVTADSLAALATAPPEQAGVQLLALAQRLRLDEVVRLRLGATGPAATAELIWARAAVGQARQTTLSQTSALTVDNADLLAGQAARALEQGWEDAAPVTLATPASASPAAPVPAPTPQLPAAPAPLASGPATAPPSAAPTPTDLSAARDALRQGEPNRALHLLTDALNAGGDPVPAFLLRARAYAALQDADHQREALAAACELDKTLYEPRLELATLQAARGLWQDAASLYREAIAARPQAPDAYLGLCALLEAQGQANQGLSTLEAGAKANPEDLSLLSALGQEYRDRDLLPAAEETYAKIAALSQGAAQAEAYRQLGHMYMQARQFGAAFGAYQKAVVAAGGSQTYFAEMFSAADGIVADSLTTAQQTLQGWEKQDPGLTREAAYQRLAATTQQLQRLADFADQAQDQIQPADQHAYNLRMVYYRLAAEASTDAMLYVDQGSGDLRDQAQQEFSDAAAMPATWGPPAG